jgi:uncharacterized RDD family membrane protein YckC
MVDAGRWGVNRIVGSLVHPVVDAVDVDAVIERVDLNEALDRVDPDRLLDRVDVNGLLDRVDVDRLLTHVDVNTLLDRVDVDALLDRVNVDRLLERADVDALLARADVAGLVARVKIGNVVTDSATSAATSVLDFGRGQLAGFDTLTSHVARRALRRDRAAPPQYEPIIADEPAGAFTRLVSYVIDVSLVTALFGMTVFVTSYLLNLFFQHDFDPTQNGGPAWAALGIAFAGFYWWVCLAVAGRTLGKALLGMRVVNVDGTPVGPGAAFIRTLVFPFSFILGIGFIPIVTAQDRRAMHDHAAGTKEIYDWGTRRAVLPAPVLRWLSRRTHGSAPTESVAH